MLPFLSNEIPRKSMASIRKICCHGDYILLIFYPFFKLYIIVSKNAVKCCFNTHVLVYDFTVFYYTYSNVIIVSYVFYFVCLLKC